VYANLTIQLADAFDSQVFRVWGAIYAAGTLFLWLLITLRSVIEMKMIFQTQKALDRVLPVVDELKRAPEGGTSSTTTRHEVAWFSN
jgi:hypothetical protein